LRQKHVCAFFCKELVAVHAETVGNRIDDVRVSPPVGPLSQHQPVAAVHEAIGEMGLHPVRHAISGSRCFSHRRSLVCPSRPGRRKPGCLGSLAQGRRTQRSMCLCAEMSQVNGGRVVPFALCIEKRYPTLRISRIVGRRGGPPRLSRVRHHRDIQILTDTPKVSEHAVEVHPRRS
jgi:hypothetical protein